MKIQISKKLIKEIKFSGDLISKKIAFLREDKKKYLLHKKIFSEIAGMNGPRAVSFLTKHSAEIDWDWMGRNLLFSEYPSFAKKTDIMEDVMFADTKSMWQACDLSTSNTKCQFSDNLKKIEIDAIKYVDKTYHSPSTTGDEAFTEYQIEERRLTHIENSEEDRKKAWDKYVSIRDKFIWKRKAYDEEINIRSRPIMDKINKINQSVREECEYKCSIIKSKYYADIAKLFIEMYLDR